MPCDKADARPREEPAIEVGRVALIAAILQRRPSSTNDGYDLGREAKEAGNMVVNCFQEFWKA